MTPVPERETIAGELVALLAVDMLPVTLPAAVGAKMALKWRSGQPAGDHDWSNFHVAHLVALQPGGRVTALLGWNFLLCSV